MEIEICPRCHGNGTRKLTDHYGDPHWSTCEYCNGTGRIKVIEWRHRLEIPFDDDEKYKKALDVNSKTFETFRTLSKDL
jgi:hypothetical protein